MGNQAEISDEEVSDDPFYKESLVKLLLDCKRELDDESDIDLEAIREGQEMFDNGNFI